MSDNLDLAPYERVIRSGSGLFPGEVSTLVAEVRRLRAERDLLRDLLVSAEGYAIANGADLPFVAMFVEGTPMAEAIERAGCYPRDARREHPGRFALNPPADNEEGRL